MKTLPDLRPQLQAISKSNQSAFVKGVESSAAVSNRLKALADIVQRQGLSPEVCRALEETSLAAAAAQLGELDKPVLPSPKAVGPGVLERIAQAQRTAEASLARSKREREARQGRGVTKSSPTAVAWPEDMADEVRQPPSPAAVVKSLKQAYQPPVPNAWHFQADISRPPKPVRIVGRSEPDGGDPGPRAA
jgi:hypothetical protein